MKINFDAQILDLDGNPIKGDASLKMITIIALLSPLQGDERMDMEEKAQLFSLAMRVNAGGTLDFKAEEVAKIKHRIGKAHTVLIVGRAIQLIEGEKDAPESV